MRQKRAKAYRKLMAMYELYFGFRQPYQVLGSHTQPFTGLFWWFNYPIVDSGMCLAAQDHKIELLKQFETVLQGKTKPSEYFYAFLG
jgi:U3 small nucleolar RNA-associated protein 23